MAMGRPKIIITKDTLMQLYAKYGDWYTVANKIGVSNQTIYRRLAEYGVSRGYGGSWAR